MRYAVLSDVHGNLEALEAVLADAAAHADAVVCLGDVVGYGADPIPCVERLAERAQAVVAGNHEHGVTGQMSLAWFNQYARAAAEWTREQLDDDHRDWLAALPLTASVGDATLVHASPRHPEEWDYLVSAEDGYAAFDAFETRVCFVGHSHLPGVWSLGSAGREHEGGNVDVTLEAGRRYLVNVGSVGQPRDRDVRAAYAVWDADGRRIQIRRVAYDVNVARAKIAAAGLPRFLADRLAAGA
ncbi:MAG TPA: metallophosphoesterase family protein [Methylomirabilota bacterium]|jgi:diadenosine tetraphosphatase ApaH/serine/threonine PP2A family protein phosphatase